MAGSRSAGEAVAPVVRGKLSGLAPEVFSSEGSLDDFGSAGFSVGHVVDGFVLASGVPVEAGLRALAAIDVVYVTFWWRISYFCSLRPLAVAGGCFVSLEETHG